MLVQKISGICPFCEEAIKLVYDDVEILDINGSIVINFTCPLCREDIIEEPLEG